MEWSAILWLWENVKNSSPSGDPTSQQKNDVTQILSWWDSATFDNTHEDLFWAFREAHLLPSGKTDLLLFRKLGHRPWRFKHYCKCDTFLLAENWMPECKISSLNDHWNYCNFQLRGLNIPLTGVGLWVWRDLDFSLSHSLCFTQAYSYIYMPTDYTNGSCLPLWEPKNHFQHSKWKNTGHEIFKIRTVYSIELFV